MTPPIKPIVDSPKTFFFPEGVSEVDENSIEEIFPRFESEFLPSLMGFSPSRERIADFGARLFRNGHYRSCANFNETSVPDVVSVPWIGTQVDVSIENGAKVCADFETKTGDLILPRLTSLNGFSAWGIRPDRVILDDAGHLKIETGCCVSTDVTEKILQSPVAPLFPQNKITDLPLESFFLFQFPPPPGSSGKGRFSQVLKALNLIGFWGEICTDPLCAGPQAGVALYFNSPLIRETFETKRYQSFDLTGILKDSFIDWPQFPLSLLPLPPDIQIPEGTANLSARYDPNSKTSSINLTNLDAKILLPNLLGPESIHLSGDINLSLHAGGEIDLHFSRLKIELPSQNWGGVSLSAVINGDLRLDWDLNAALPSILEAHLSLDEINLKTDPGQGLRFGQDGVTFGLSLQGSLGVDYVPSDPFRPLVTRWDLTGSAPFETGKQAFNLREIKFEGKGSWKKIKDRFVPNLNEFKAGLFTDLYRMEGGKENLVAKGLSLKLEGQGKSVVNGVTTQKATLTAGAESLQIAGLEIVPSLNLDLTRTDQDNTFQIDADGGWTASAFNTNLHLGSQLHFTTTDLRNFDMEAAFVEDQILGDLTAKGKLKIDGRVGLIGSGSILKSFKIVTSKPYELDANGSSIEKRFTITGRGAKEKGVISLRSPSLLHRAQVSIDLYDLPWRDRLLGHYRIRARPIRSGSVTLKNIALNGKFYSVPFSELFEKKRAALSGSVDALMEGALSGGVHSDYGAVLRWAPEKSAFLLSFRSDTPSTLSVGPIEVKGEKTIIEGNANLQGTVLVRYGGGRIGIGGDDLGFHQGKVFVGLDGAIPVDEQGEKIPAIFDFRFVADQLKGIRNGVALCGGSRCLLEGNVDLSALKIAFDRAQSKLPFFKTPHRIQLSPAAWWGAFRSYVLGGP